MTAMYEWLEIKGFRGIRELRIEGLRRVNVFLGANGSGKSTVLEAVAMLCSGANAEMPLILNQTRGVPFETESPSIEALFRAPAQADRPAPCFAVSGGPLDGAERADLEMTGRQQSGPSLDDRGGAVAGLTSLYGLEATCRLSSGEQPPTHVWGRGEARRATAPVLCTHEHYRMGLGIRLDWLTRWLAAASRLRIKGEVVEFLRRHQPGLLDLEVQPVGDGFAVFGVFDEGPPLPVEVLGAGFYGMLACLLMCATCAGGSLLLDELDSGLHHSSVLPYLNALRTESGRWRTQVFATTHNMELLRYLREAFAGEPDALMIYRLERRGEAHQVVEIDFEGLEVATEARWEIR